MIMLFAGGLVLLGALWIVGHALSLMPSVALSPAVIPAPILSAQVTPERHVPAGPVAQYMPTEAPDMPTEAPAATSGPASPAHLAAGPEAMAEDTDGTPLPQRRFLIEARADAIFGAEPDQPLPAMQEADSGTTASGASEQAVAERSAVPDRQPVTQTKAADRRAKAAPPPRRHVNRARVGSRIHVSRRPPSLRKVVRQINPLRSLRLGGLRVF